MMDTTAWAQEPDGPKDPTPAPGTPPVTRPTC